MLKQQAAILKPNDREFEPRSADHSAATPAGDSRSDGRFVYAGGSRPLSGYTIKRGVGRGGFGEIYFAVSDAGKEVALKLIRRNLDVELRGIRQCLNLKHPNLLDIHDIRRDGQGDAWVIMEYVADRNLESVLNDNPNGLSREEALDWIRGIAAGVAYLHDHGIVHRDLKPGNIFRDEGIVKIGDYGLSKFISCNQRSGQTESIGTVHYMAPEIAGGRYGKEIDVYALGVILYELLTGRIPFDGESVGEVLMKHLTAKPDVSMLAQPFRDVVARALEKDPEMRYRSASEMVAALDTKPLPSVAPEVNGIKPRPVVATVAALTPGPSPNGRGENSGATNGRGFMDHRFNWREKPIPAMLVKPPREKLAELAGSLLLGSLTAAVMCIVAELIGGYYNSLTPRLEQFAWLLLVSVTGTCAVLLPSKCWEGYRGDAFARRFITMTIGMCVGVAAFFLAELLLVATPAAAGFPDSPDYQLPSSFYHAENGRPMLLAYMAVFGTLFLLIRWWRQANPLRKARFSLGSVLVCVVAAALVAHLWQFPQPILPMIAGTISVSVQLAAPWLSAKKRRLRREGF